MKKKTIQNKMLFLDLVCVSLYVSYMCVCFLRYNQKRKAKNINISENKAYARFFSRNIKKKK